MRPSYLLFLTYHVNQELSKLHTPQYKWLVVGPTSQFLSPKSQSLSSISQIPVSLFSLSYLLSLSGGTKRRRRGPEATTDGGRGAEGAPRFHLSSSDGSRDGQAGVERRWDAERISPEPPDHGFYFSFTRASASLLLSARRSSPPRPEI